MTSSSNASSAESPEQVRRIAREEVELHLHGIGEATIAAVIEGARENEHTMSYVSWVASIWIALFTLIVGAAGAFLYGEVGILKKAKEEAQAASETSKALLAQAVKAKDEAEASSSKVHAAEEDAKLAASRLRAFDEASKNALADIDNYHKNLPSVESPTVLGSQPELPPIDHVMQMEEADILTVPGRENPTATAQTTRARVSLLGKILETNR